MRSDSPLFGIRILVLDDSQDTSNLFRFILEAEGSYVQSVSSIAQALQILSQDSVDLLLCETKLPDGSSYPVIEAIRKGELGSNPYLPAVAITASVYRADQEKAIAAGFQGFLAKPVEPSELVLTASKLMQTEPNFCRISSINKLNLTPKSLHHPYAKQHQILR